MFFFFSIYSASLVKTLIFSNLSENFPNNECNNISLLHVFYVIRVELSQNVEVICWNLIWKLGKTSSIIIMFNDSVTSVSSRFY